ncbi:MAG: ATP phosphoribosyltransferase regulatory subunit [Clostridia bacterium]|nr:ATP phosphoribosyltransferase regulatory subunit [Clostridia bacterium]
MKENKFLKSGEKAIVSLRSLYKQYGYLPFKMGKFEEYDLYVRNKEFLVGDSVITFNDTDGRLLALKPDVTLSIIKNTADECGTKKKVYYNENVYRVSPKTHKFKEIMQAGIECIGDTDILDVYEIISLAANSLSLLSEDFVLDLSHLGILSRVLSAASESDGFKKEITRLISEKNKHEIKAVADAYSVSGEYTDMILAIVDTYGSADAVLKALYPICERVGALDAYGELAGICSLISKSPIASKINLDFSVVNDMNYYNGIVFKGFLKGIPDGVLSGGEYGMLMRRMGRKSNAIGFAIYLDLLDELGTSRKEYDVDVLLLYSEASDAEKLLSVKDKLIAEGKSVSMQKAIPRELRFKEIIDTRK